MDFVFSKSILRLFHKIGESRTKNVTLFGTGNAKFQKNVRDFLVQWNNGKFDYILSYSESVPSMLLGNKTLEITDVVIKEINNEYKSSNIKK